MARQWLEIGLALGALGVSTWLVWVWLGLTAPGSGPAVVTGVRTFYQIELVVLAAVVLGALLAERRDRSVRLEWLWLALGAQAGMALLGILTIGPALAIGLALGAAAGLSAVLRVGAQLGRLLFLASFGFLLQGLLMVGIIVAVSWLAVYG